MLLLRAKRDNIPFYKTGDAKTKEEWLIKLNLSSKEFDILAASDFKEESNELTVVRNLNADRECISISIQCSNGPVPEQAANSLISSINDLLKAFNT